MIPDDAIHAYHILQHDRKLRYKDGRQVLIRVPMEMLPVVCYPNFMSVVEQYTLLDPMICNAGMHGSFTIRSALIAASEVGMQPKWLCEVRIWGDVSGTPNDKVVGRWRVVDRWWDVHEFLDVYTDGWRMRIPKEEALQSRLQELKDGKVHG